MRSRAWALMLTSMVVLNCLPSRATEPQQLVEYQSPEWFTAHERPDDFLPYARRFLNQHPQDPRAARIALDMWTVAAAKRDLAYSDEAQQRLLLDYPDSIPTSFLLSVSKPDEVRRVLSARFQSSDKPLDRQALRNFSRAFDLYTNQNGPPDDEAFLMQGALASDSIVIAYERRQKIARDSDAGQILEIALNTRLSQLTKFLRLQAFRENKTAKAYQLYLYNQELTVAERGDPKVETVVVQNLLEGYAFKAALPRLAKLRAGSNDPQFALWQGWAQGATGDTAGAIATFDELMRTAPNSAWAKSAAPLRAALVNLEQNLADHASVLDRVARSLVAPPEVLEMRIHWKSKTKVPCEAYLCLNLARDELEFLGWCDGEPQAGYRVASRDSRLFAAHEQVNQMFTHGGSPLYLDYKFQIVPEGGFQRSFNFSFATNLGPPSHRRQVLLSSVGEALARTNFRMASQRASWLKHAVASGCFPEAVQTGPEQIVLRWRYVKLDQAELGFTEVCASAEGELLSINCDNEWGCKEVRYGSEGLALQPPAWPAAPQKIPGEMTFAACGRLVGALVPLFKGERASANMANQPGTMR